MENKIEKITHVGINQQITEETVKNYLFGAGVKLSDSQLMLFKEMAISLNLNPFKREIYCIKYGDNFSIVTSYLEYIKRAERSGKMDGWSVENTPTGARITINRKDWSSPFIWEVATKEFNRGVGLWKSSPEFMIKKVAICQGFRLAFPDEVAGLPYSPEEIEQEAPEQHQNGPGKKELPEMPREAINKTIQNINKCPNESALITYWGKACEYATQFKAMPEAVKNAYRLKKKEFTPEVLDIATGKPVQGADIAQEAAEQIKMEVA